MSTSSWFNELCNKRVWMTEPVEIMLSRISDRTVCQTLGKFLLWSYHMGFCLICTVFTLKTFSNSFINWNVISYFYMYIYILASFESMLPVSFADHLASDISPTVNFHFQITAPISTKLNWNKSSFGKWLLLVKTFLAWSPQAKEKCYGSDENMMRVFSKIFFSWTKIVSNIITIDLKISKTFLISCISWLKQDANIPRNQSYFQFTDISATNLIWSWHDLDLLKI